MSAVIIGLNPFPDLVRGLDHSCTTWVTTPITPMQLTHSLTRSEIRTTTVMPRPKYFRKLVRMVKPVNEVYLPNNMIRKKVKMHESKRGQIMVNP